VARVRCIPAISVDHQLLQTDQVTVSSLEQVGNRLCGLRPTQPPNLSEIENER